MVIRMSIWSVLLLFGCMPMMYSKVQKNYSSQLHKKKIPKKEHNKKAIFIVGPGRCGSSCLTGVLYILGLHLGSGLLGAHPTNSKGFFEDAETVKLNQTLLAELKQSRLSPRMIDWSQVKMYQQIYNRIYDHVKRKFGNSTMFGLKDPRLSLLLPFYIQAARDLGYKPKIMIALRNPTEIAASLHKAYGVRPIEAFKAISNFLTTIIRDTENLEVIAIYFDDLIYKTEKTVNKIRTLLPELKEYNDVKKELADFIDEGLKHF